MPCGHTVSSKNDSVDPSRCFVYNTFPVRSMTVQVKFLYPGISTLTVLKVVAGLGNISNDPWTSASMTEVIWVALKTDVALSAMVLEAPVAPWEIKPEETSTLLRNFS